MNIALLEKLGELVRPGHAEFGGYKVAFSMSRYFTIVEGDVLVPKRADLGGQKYDAISDLVGFTFILTGNAELLLKPPEADWRPANYRHQAGYLLGLTWDQHRELFLGTHDDMITGEQAHRCIRGLTITGRADWFEATKP